MRVLISFLFISYLFNSFEARGLPEPNVKNLRARYDHRSKSIYVEWDYDEPTDSK